MDVICSCCYGYYYFGVINNTWVQDWTENTGLGIRGQGASLHTVSCPAFLLWPFRRSLPFLESQFILDLQPREGQNASSPGTHEPTEMGP